MITVDSYTLAVKAGALKVAFIDQRQKVGIGGFGVVRTTCHHKQAENHKTKEDPNS